MVNNKLLFKNMEATVEMINSVGPQQVAINIQETIPSQTKNEMGDMALLVTNLRAEIKRLRDCLYVLSSIATANNELSLRRIGVK